MTSISSLAGAPSIGAKSPRIQSQSPPRTPSPGSLSSTRRSKSPRNTLSFRPTLDNTVEEKEDDVIPSKSNYKGFAGLPKSPRSPNTNKNPLDASSSNLIMSSSWQPPSFLNKEIKFEKDEGEVRTLDDRKSKLLSSMKKTEKPNDDRDPLSKTIKYSYLSNDKVDDKVVTPKTSSGLLDMLSESPRSKPIKSSLLDSDSDEEAPGIASRHGNLFKKNRNLGEIPRKQKQGLDSSYNVINDILNETTSKDVVDVKQMSPKQRVRISDPAQMETKPERRSPAKPVAKKSLLETEIFEDSDIEIEEDDKMATTTSSKPPIHRRKDTPVKAPVKSEEKKKPKSSMKRSQSWSKLPLTSTLEMYKPKLTADSARAALDTSDVSLSKTIASPGESKYIQESVFSDWYHKKTVDLRKKKELNEETEKLKRENLEKESRAKIENSEVAFAYWKKRKDKITSKTIKQDVHSNKEKEAKEKENTELKRFHSSKSYDIWKEKKEKSLKETYRKKLEIERERKTAETRKKEEKKKMGISTVKIWNQEKEEYIKEEQKKQQENRRTCRNRNKQEEHMKKDGARVAYHKWLVQKDETEYNNSMKRSQSAGALAVRPAFKPCGRIIAYGR